MVHVVVLTRYYLLLIGWVHLIENMRAYYRDYHHFHQPSHHKILQYYSHQLYSQYHHILIEEVFQLTNLEASIQQLGRLIKHR